MLKGLCLLCLPAFTFLSPAIAQNTELHVAAAADMQPVMEILGPLFEQKNHVKLLISYGSSGTLTTQIINGAPIDIFLGADFYFPEKIIAANLADSGSPVPYAKGLLVLWTRKSSPFNPLHLEALSDPKLKSVSIANPSTAPYGRAAEAALKKMNLYDKVSSHLVQAENVGQAGQFAESGNAELGLISQTLAMSPRFKNEGSFVLFPTYVYPEIRQCAVVLRNSSHRTEAHQLLNFLLSEEGQSALPKLGLVRVQ